MKTLRVGEEKGDAGYQGHCRAFGHFRGFGDPACGAIRDRLALHSIRLSKRAFRGTKGTGIVTNSNRTPREQRAAAPRGQASVPAVGAPRTGSFWQRWKEWERENGVVHPPVQERAA
ncbi:MAG TPA: hypothetical protein VGC35_00555 [Allosphingosinicella sp.]|jgi:hypothetical protein